jgi:hypothetical protein
LRRFLYTLMDCLPRAGLHEQRIQVLPNQSRDSVFSSSNPSSWRRATGTSSHPTPPTMACITKGAVDASWPTCINAGYSPRRRGGRDQRDRVQLLHRVHVSGGLNACQAALNRADSVLLPQRATSSPTRSRRTSGPTTPTRRKTSSSSSSSRRTGWASTSDAGAALQPVQSNAVGRVCDDRADVQRASTSLDRRRQIFLVGPQRNVETGVFVNDRAGNPPVFTTSIADITATEGEAPIYKYPADLGTWRRTTATTTRCSAHGRWSSSRPKPS